MSQKIWDTIPAQYQQIITDLAFDIGQQFTAENEAAEQDWIKKFQEQGVTFINVDIGPFQAKASKLYDNIPSWTPGIYQAIQKAIGR
jgi:TRAP-type C4-dicarboxylate transport system substrate-binding protein